MSSVSVDELYWATSDVESARRSCRSLLVILREYRRAGQECAFELDLFKEKWSRYRRRLAHLSFVWKAEKLARTEDLLRQLCLGIERQIAVSTLDAETQTLLREAQTLSRL